MRYLFGTYIFMLPQNQRPWERSWIRSKYLARCSAGVPYASVQRDRYDDLWSTATSLGRTARLLFGQYSLKSELTAVLFFISFGATVTSVYRRFAVWMSYLIILQMTGSDNHILPENISSVMDSPSTATTGSSLTPSHNTQFDGKMSLPRRFSYTSVNRYRLHHWIPKCFRLLIFCFSHEVAGCFNIVVTGFVG